jgi:ribonuclease P protein component
MRLLRLRGRKICDRLLRQGVVWKGKTLNIRWMSGAPRHPSSRPDIPSLYVGAIASAKLDKSAVRRNRMRRRCKEALRLELGEILAKASGEPDMKRPSLQLLLAPRSSSLNAPFQDIRSDVRAFLSSHIHGSSKTQ